MYYIFLIIVVNHQIIIVFIYQPSLGPKSLDTRPYYLCDPKPLSKKLKQLTYKTFTMLTYLQVLITCITPV